MLLQKKEKEERKYIKERMKKKKEFFRIRKSKKRKNGANARAYVRMYTETEPATVCRFLDKREENDRRPRKARPLFCFLNITDRV